MGRHPLQKVSTRQLSDTSIFSKSSDDSSDPLILPSKELLCSPPSSPTLHALPSTKKRRRLESLKVLRLLLHISTWILVGGFLLWALTALFIGSSAFKANISYLDNVDGNDTLIHNDTLPEQPLPVAAVDKDGKSRWTISISPYEEFPLKPKAYAHICTKAHNLAHHLEILRGGNPGHFGYYHVDDKFLDVSEAEEARLLPLGIPAHHESVVRTSDTSSTSNTTNRDPKTGVCKRSLTYVLESTDAGFGNALMGLWLSYGLALKEDRAFFIDDRKWAYGTYTTFFLPPPPQPCLPPPETHRLPCPHHAAHLLVSGATTHWTFGHAFNEEYEDPRGMEVQRQKPIFTFMRAGYEALFHLTSADAEFVESRVSELQEEVFPGLAVGMHIRRGDKKPYEQKFAQNGLYVPSERFVDVANDELLGDADPTNRTNFELALNRSRMVVASDDPSVFGEWELRGQERAQMRVVLADSKADEVNVAAFPEWEGEKVKVPWEGGFYSSKFWKMGKKEDEEEEDGDEEDEEDEKGSGWFNWGADPASKTREMMGRAYILDLAVISRMDRTICTVSATGCRLLAVMMGWERSFEAEEWINVDGDWYWKGIRWS